MTYDVELHKQINLAVKKGWKLCVGCIDNFGDGERCTCGIDKRKRMGLSPAEVIKEINGN